LYELKHSNGELSAHKLRIIAIMVDKPDTNSSYCKLSSTHWRHSIIFSYRSWFEMFQVAWLKQTVI